MALIEDLRVAMTDGSLVLHYQPEVDLRTGQVMTLEALLRWPHPTLGLIPPEHLLALAQESGLVHALAAWVFEEALKDCARWWHDGHEVAVAVNLLATDLLDSSLPGRVGELLRRAGLPPHALVLEITEGMVMADVTRSKRVIQSLKDSGSPGLDRRLRDRLLLAHPPERPGGRRTQAGPHVHVASPGRQWRRPGREHRPFDHPPRPCARAARRRRGHRAAGLRRRHGRARL